MKIITRKKKKEVEELFKRLNEAAAEAIRKSESKRYNGDKKDGREY